MYCQTAHCPVHTYNRSFKVEASVFKQNSDKGSLNKVSLVWQYGISSNSTTQTYLQSHYGNWVFYNVYLSAGQHFEAVDFSSYCVVCSIKSHQFFVPFFDEFWWSTVIPFLLKPWLHIEQSSSSKLFWGTLLHFYCIDCLHIIIT